MKIFFNGDSHTSGSELKNPDVDTYCHVLTKLLGGTLMSNPSIGGGSNDRILRTTEKFLYDCDNKKEYPDFVVIGWTETTRMDWFYNGRYRSLNSDDGLDPKTASSVNQERYSYSLRCISHDAGQPWIVRYQHEKMYNLHLELEYRKIPHLFFNGVKSFPQALHASRPGNDKLEERIIIDSYNYYFIRSFGTLLDIKKYDWNNSFWKPYDIDGCFLQWGLNKGYQPTEWNHHGVEAHYDFANLLFQHIKDTNLLSCPSDN